MTITPAKRPPRVTSFDVAEAAGVSQSTVSRALAGDSSISEPTRMRVTEAARKLNYQVDENAARLRRGRTGTLTVLMICRAGQDRDTINPFYFSLLGSACAAAAARGYETLVSFQDSPDNFWGLYQERRKADGMIVIGTTENAAAWDYFRALPPGTHWVCWGSPHDDLAWVRSDNLSGATLATRHMLVRGYTKIACIGSLTSPQRQFKERYEGYARAMQDAGLEPRLIEFEPGHSREEQGRRATARLIESGEPFDGIFAVCDEMALGALKELAARDIKVPHDVGIVGFDGIRAGAWSTPPLTTIEPDFHIAGELLVDKLLGVIAGDKPTVRRAPVRLVVRGSTRP